MDALAAKFIEAAGSVRDALIQDVIAYGDDAKHYARVMQKVVSGSEAYIEKELKRYLWKSCTRYCDSDSHAD